MQAGLREKQDCELASCRAVHWQELALALFPAKANEPEEGLLTVCITKHANIFHSAIWILLM